MYIAIYWPQEGKVFEGTLEALEVVDNIYLSLTVRYADGDVETHVESDDDFDWTYVNVLDREPVAEPRPLWRWADLPFHARAAMQGALEELLHVKLVHVLTQANVVRLGRFCSIRLKWTHEMHMLFFGSVQDVLMDTDDEMVTTLAPLCKKLPHKRIGHQKGTQRLQICARGLVRRSKNGASTQVFFAYSRYDLRTVEGNEKLVNMWAPVQGTPGVKK